MILSHWSTALTEAALLCKPVILMDLFNPSDLAPYADLGYCRIVRDQDSLNESVNKLCRGLINGIQPGFNADKNEFERIFGKKDSQNTKRVVDYIETYVSK